MRIELLRLRENFDDGFIASLSDFLLAKYQWQGHMYWCKGVVETLEKKQCAFYVNDLLNIIYPSVIPREQLTPFTKEFTYNPGFLRRLLQRIYVFAAVRYPFSLFTTSATLIIEKAPDEMKGWVFLPGNHSHRIIDLNKAHSLVFAKRGFNIDFLKADAETRMQNTFLPAPEVLEYSPGQNWFVEQLVTGLPINRLSRQSDQVHAIQQANQAMLRLYESTQQSISLESYVQQLDENIQQQINQIKMTISPQQNNDLLGFSEQLQSHLLSAKSDKLLDIPLALSHGDFQAANILLDKSRVWLIDWEYAGLRSLYFDAFCQELNSRFSEGLTARLENLLEKMQERVLFDWLPVPILPGSRLLLWLFLLEEFLLKLTEVSTPEIQQKVTNILPWVQQVQAVKIFKEND